MKKYSEEEYEEVEEEDLAEEEEEKVEVTEEENLFEILRKKSFEQLMYLARRSTTPPETLAELARRPFTWNIRLNVAKNLSTPVELLIELSGDGNDGVRIAVVENPNTPPEVLMKLSQDPYSDVRVAVAGNKNTPPEALVDLSKNRRNFDILRKVYRNPNTPLEIKEELKKRIMIKRKPVKNLVINEDVEREYEEEAEEEEVEEELTEKEKLEEEAEMVKEHKGTKILIDRKKVSVDTLIAPLVKAFSDIGVDTYESCQGDISRGDIYISTKGKVIAPGFIILNRKAKPLLSTLKKVDPKVVVKSEAGAMGYDISEYVEDPPSNREVISFTFTVKPNVKDAEKVLANFYSKAAKIISQSSIANRSGMRKKTNVNVLEKGDFIVFNTPGGYAPEDDIYVIVDGQPGEVESFDGEYYSVNVVPPVKITKDFIPEGYSVEKLVNNGVWVVDETGKWLVQVWGLPFNDLEKVEEPPSTIPSAEERIEKSEQKKVELFEKLVEEKEKKGLGVDEVEEEDLEEEEGEKEVEKQILPETERTKETIEVPYSELLNKYTEDEIWDIASGRKTDVTEEEIEAAKYVITKGIVASRLSMRKKAFIMYDDKGREFRIIQEE